MSGNKVLPHMLMETGGGQILLKIPKSSHHRETGKHQRFVAVQVSMSSTFYA